MRVVEKWCRRGKATMTVDDALRAGWPRAPLASVETIHLLLTEGIKRSDQCPQLAVKILLGVNVGDETIRRYLNTYISRQMWHGKRILLTLKHMRVRLHFAKQ
jgi:hypothetical protein